MIPGDWPKLLLYNSDSITAAGATNQEEEFEKE
jgi:hypothetical protein